MTRNPFMSTYLRDVEEAQKKRQEHEQDMRTQLLYWHHRALAMKQALEDILKSPCSVGNNEADIMRQLARNGLEE